MPIITWELWLARDIVLDNPLPWQKSIDKLTPGRVAQARGGVLAFVGTPASPPKPRGKSPSVGKPDSHGHVELTIRLLEKVLLSRVNKLLSRLSSVIFLIFIYKFFNHHRWVISHILV